MKGLIEMLDKSKRGKAGFTLIELMIVIIIVGVLAAAAVPIYTGFVKRAYLTEAKAVVGAIRAAELVYLAEHDEWLWPDDLALPDTAGKLTTLGVDITRNSWFKTPDLITWVPDLPAGAGTDKGVNIVGTGPPVANLGAQINFESGVIETTSDGSSWVE